MAINEKRTGLYIYELEELLGNIKTESWFAISQDNMTRKVSSRTIRQFMNGDNDEPSDELYYSSNKVESLFETTGDTINEIINDISSINQRLDDIANSINSNFKTLNDRITSEVNNLNRRIDNEVSALNARIDSEVAELNRKINQLRDELHGWILYGTSVPTNSTLPAGRLYIQYF